MSQRQRAVRKANIVRATMKPAASKMFGYRERTERACDAWRQGNLTFAAHEFEVLSKHPKASEYERMEYTELSQGCKILAGQIKHPEDFNAMCSACGHDRFWHVLVVACIQCLNPETKESSCRGFVP